ncbi:hypothetical protein [Lactobacillus amylolyticus]|uniref:hypothetical protein n=1 Tax=Lactobacillus amylolyticus TaxID=83683 RepID=UPI002490C0E7|nr:hypothetical protein [Lactobacillus amylolyticus]
MKLDEFLTQALIDSLNNGLIAPELITVYAGNYLAKSLITQDEMTEVTTAITAYQTTQAQGTSTSESTSESASAATSGSASDTDSTSTSESASAS